MKTISALLCVAVLFCGCTTTRKMDLKMANGSTAIGVDVTQIDWKNTGQLILGLAAAGLAGYAAYQADHSGGGAQNTYNGDVWSITGDGNNQGNRTDNSVSVPGE